MNKLVAGCGYLGRRVARQWQKRGHNVIAVTRSPVKAAEFSAQGWQPVVADLTQPASLKKLSDIDTVLFGVGYDRASNQSIQEVYTQSLSNLLAFLPEDVQRVIYISSTGIYSQNNGEWVTEDSPCRPNREGGAACLAAEELLRAHPLGRISVILRLAGLYGPGRIPRREDLLAGRPIAAPSRGYLNLIHADDAAQIVLAVEDHARPPALYLVSDGAPVLRSEYYLELARLLGTPPPRFEEPPSETPSSQRAAADKRISNQRLRSEIPFTLVYPSYREGLAAIVTDATT
jgi:nucleoside-diphosphate-sugar epimerase